jgi:PAS domain S-box-containing protein
MPVRRHFVAEPERRLFAKSDGGALTLNMIESATTSRPTPAIIRFGQAAALGLVVFALVWISIILTRRSGHAASIWPANAVVLSCLLRSDIRRWPALLLAGLAGNMAAGIAIDGRLLVDISLAACNTLEIGLAAFSLYRFLGLPMDFSKPRNFWLFAAMAGGAAPLTAAALASALMGALTGASALRTMGVWALGDSLGILTITPALLLLTPKALASLTARTALAKNLLLLLGYLGVLAAVFGQTRYPLQALVVPAMALVAFQLELAGAALAALLTVMVALVFQQMGRGPITLMTTGLISQVFTQQLNLAIAATSMLAIASTVAHRRELRETLTRSLAESVAARAEAQEADQALRASEARYRLLAENASDLILQNDRKGRLTYISPAVTRVFGYAQDELLGRETLSLIHPEDVPGVQGVVTSLLRAPDAPPVTMEYRARHKNGSWVWFETRPRLVLDPDTGRPTGVMDILRDITARKAAEAELDRALKAAEAATEAKSEFLSNMGHEIRTPLTGIIGFSGLLEELDGLPQNALGYVRRIVTAGRSLLAVVNDILDFSKLEARQVELDPHPFAPAGFIEETVDLVGVQALNKGLALHTAIADDVPQMVEADSARLRQILLNLLTNAVKFTDKGSVSLAVTYQGHARRLHVVITDTGVGVPAERRDRLFQRFSQADGSINRSHGGTGLGLAICKGLVELMGGEIGVDTALGQGSTFWFSVMAPAVQAGVAEADAAPAMLEMSAPAHILLVDDLSTNRELVKALLGPFGHTFEEATNGIEAVQAALQTPFDLILMDLQMPAMDGLTASRIIRETAEANRTTPIIALSANVLAEHVAACAEAGMDDHLGKPIRPIELLTKVAQWTATREAEAAEPLETLARRAL